MMPDGSLVVVPDGSLAADTESGASRRPRERSTAGEVGSRGMEGN